MRSLALSQLTTQKRLGAIFRSTRPERGLSDSLSRIIEVTEPQTVWAEYGLRVHVPPTGAFGIPKQVSSGALEHKNIRFASPLPFVLALNLAQQFFRCNSYSWHGPQTYTVVVDSSTPWFVRRKGFGGNFPTDRARKTVPGTDMVRGVQSDFVEHHRAPGKSKGRQSDELADLRFWPDSQELSGTLGDPREQRGRSSVVRDRIVSGRERLIRVLWLCFGAGE
ncbi:hypothetical protein RRG08_032625 [Elysia crispata]|uniref:Uncharacterized protein n=1 Tax=Elysia crispata TaxID=231223 RepID=A0AAE1CQ97_9GAST|nr:hypothetical protein RRG08_032625 [Elysia crispata]